MSCCGMALPTIPKENIKGVCIHATLQAEAQGRAAELESLLRAERNAQRDLKLVLAAAERQSQSDACDKSELAAKCVAAFPNGRTAHLDPDLEENKTRCQSQELES